MINKKIGGILLWARNSVWAFPVLLLLFFGLLTVFKISGTSVGVYHQSLYGNTVEDPDLLYGMPQPIRSDEWLGSAQLIVSQAKNDFPRVNPDMGSGRDVSLVSDLPTKDWPTVFRPHNWGFLVLPVEHAYALKWWYLSFILIVSCYFFTLRILPGQKFFAIVFGLAIGMTPFVLWWYQAAASAILAYGFLIIILCVRLLNGERVRWIKSRRMSVVLQIVALALLLSFFGMILYPPFQISVAIVIFFYLLGWLLHKKLAERVELKQLGRRLGFIVVAIVIAAAIGTAFILTRQETINTINSTRYPGARVVESGGVNFLSVFDSFMMPQLQRISRAANFFTNQSEASNFILLAPFLLIPGFALTFYEYRKRRRIDWPFVMVQAVILLMLARMFIPIGDPFYKILLLDKVPHGRLIIGLGFAGIIQLLYIFKKIVEVKISGKKLWMYASAYGFVCFGVLMLVGAYTVEHYSKFIGYELVALAAIAFTSILVFLLAKKAWLALAVFLFFSILSSFRIMPIYQGLGFITDGEVINKIEKVSPADATWGTVDSIYYEHLGLLAGRESITGIQIYPDLDFWEQVGGDKYERVYNRQGHILITDNPSLTDPLVLTQPNMFIIKFACSDFILKNVDYLASVRTMEYECLEPVGAVSYPQVTFYLYKLNK